MQSVLLLTIFALSTFAFAVPEVAASSSPAEALTTTPSQHQVNFTASNTDYNKRHEYAAPYIWVWRHNARCAGPPSGKYIIEYKNACKANSLTSSFTINWERSHATQDSVNLYKDSKCTSKPVVIEHGSTFCTPGSGVAAFMYMSP